MYIFKFYIFFHNKFHCHFYKFTLDYETEYLDWALVLPFITIQKITKKFPRTYGITFKRNGLKLNHLRSKYESTKTKEEKREVKL